MYLFYHKSTYKVKRFVKLPNTSFSIVDISFPSRYLIYRNNYMCVTKCYILFTDKNMGLAKCITERNKNIYNDSKGLSNSTTMIKDIHGKQCPNKPNEYDTKQLLLPFSFAIFIYSTKAMNI